MSQIDQLIYLPLLFWFIVALGFYYLTIVKLVVPCIYIMYRLRFTYYTTSVKASSMHKYSMTYNRLSN